MSTDILTVAQGVIALIDGATEIYNIAAKAMDAAEALQNSGLDGSEKKLWGDVLCERCSF